MRDKLARIVPHNRDPFKRNLTRFRGVFEVGRDPPQSAIGYVLPGRHVFYTG